LRFPHLVLIGARFAGLLALDKRAVALNCVRTEKGISRI
jgi:hypothetical protein